MKPLTLGAVLLFASAPSLGHAFDLQAHRGGRGLSPENTLPAFANALSLGVHTLELDTQVTRDDVVVVGHDPVLLSKIVRDAEGRFLAGAGPAVRTLSFAELQRYDVGRINPEDRYAKQFATQTAVDGARMPKLADVFALVRKARNTDVRFNIETKLDPGKPALSPEPDAFADALVALIKAEGMTERVAIQSFDWRSLARVGKVAPEIPRVCLTAEQQWLDNIRIGQPGPSPWTAGLDVDDHGGSVPALVKAAGCAVWSPFFGDASAERIAEAKRLGLKVVAWTVNEAADMASLIDRGVDGIISDYPDILRTVMTERKLPLPAPTPVVP